MKDNEINKNFLNYIQTNVGKEKDKIMTQELLSQKIGYTEVSLSRYLNGIRTMPADAVFKIKKALNISDEVFMQFYAAYSSKTGNDFFNKFLCLNEENQNKVLNYIEFLRDENVNEEIKENLHELIKSMNK